MSMTLVDWSARIQAMADALSVPDGGFSVDPQDGSDVRIGFAVAVHPEHERVYLGRVSGSDVAEYVRQVREALSLPGRVLGGWRDPASGNAYLDVSVVTPDRSEAFELAARTGQLAVFDFAAMASVPAAVALAA
ncbi:hypothetical protein GCM10017774_90230 [Lentzea cavernae]|uniref:Uncharacterized protein n=2 Tax=Lentzea cavernae TaxID=2020703 RepID=A0ABQ3MTX6_9PSEU|nr:hypothetical protein GCM10017774_90230 [Lentzea cavernae]